MAQIYVGVVPAFFVDHAVWIRVVRYEVATLEMFFEEVLVETDGDQRLRFAFWIASVPGRIRSADCGRKAVAWSQEIDRTSLAVISSHDAGSSALIRGD